MSEQPTGRSDAEQLAGDMLRRIGWHPSDLVQIEVYVRMSPARKVEQMLELRDGLVRMLETRLKGEHPEMGPADIKRVVLEHLELAREADK